MFKNLELGSKQRRTVAAAVTLGAVLVLLAVFGMPLWGLARFVGVFKNILLPPIVAGILAMLLRPYYNLMVKACRGSQTGGLVLFFSFRAHFSGSLYLVCQRFCNHPIVPVGRRLAIHDKCHA